MARAWVDGRLLDAPPPARAADGVFETLRCERGAFGFVAEHLDRLERGARALELAWPPPFEPRAALAALARALDLEHAAVRLSWCPPELALVAREVAPLARPLVARLALRGALEPPRPHGVKTTRRADYDRARAQAFARGEFEVLVRAPDGALIEGTATNLFLALDGELATPALDSGALPGIVRAAVLTELEREPLRAGGVSWRARERRLELGDLARAGEVLLTSSVRRVAALDRWLGDEGASAALPGADGPLARALLDCVARLEGAGAAPG